MLANHPGLSAALVFGPFTGSLSGGDEEVVLGQPVTIPGPLTYFAAVDEVADRLPSRSLSRRSTAIRTSSKSSTAAPRAAMKRALA